MSRAYDRQMAEFVSDPTSFYPGAPPQGYIQVLREGYQGDQGDQGDLYGGSSLNVQRAVLLASADCKRNRILHQKV